MYRLEALLKHFMLFILTARYSCSFWSVWIVIGDPYCMLTEWRDNLTVPFMSMHYW